MVWSLLVTNLVVLNERLVLIISLIILADFLIKLVFNSIHFKVSSILTLGSLLILTLQLLSIELWNGQLEFINTIMRTFVSVLLLATTLSKINDKTETETFLIWSVSTMILVVFVSVIFQLGFPEVWNSFVLVNNRWVSDLGQTGRAFGLMFNALDLVFLSTTFLIILHLFKNSFTKRWYRILFLIVHVQLFLTFSRAAIAVLLVSLFIARREWINVRGIVPVVSLIIFIGSANVFYGSGLERLTSLKSDIGTFANGFSTENRKGIYNEVFQNIEKVPIVTGLGYTGRDKVIDRSHRSHNTFLESYVSAGFPGIFFTAIITIVTGIKLSRKTQRVSVAYFVFFAPFASYLTIGHALTTFTFYFLILIGNLPKIKN